MKKITIILLFLVTAIVLRAQTLSPNVSPSSGGYSSGSGVSLSWTLGEPIFTSLSGGSYKLSQGFQQPEVSFKTGSISGNTYCAGDSVFVPFTIDGVLGNSYTASAQLSDANGSFSSPVTIGSRTGSGTIRAKIPSNTSTGSSYRIRVSCVVPAIIASDNGSNITINALPAVTTTPSGTVAIAPGNSATLTASAGNSYLWTGGATTQAISVNSNGTYSVTVTDGSGCSATSANVTVNVVNVPKTKLYATSCGSTVASLSSVVYINNVIGATNYQYKFIDNLDQSIIERTVGNSNNYFSLSQVTGVKTGHVYKVVVKAQYNAAWGNYGDTCLLYMPALPKTKLYPTSCGTTVNSLSAVIYANNISGATDYKYKFIDVSDYSSIEQLRGNSTNYISLSMVNGLKYSHTYKVVVKIQMNAVWGSYGDTCLLNMPPIPKTKLYSNSCGSTAATMSSIIYANNVSGATDYKYKFIDVSDNSFVEQTRGNSNNYLSLSSVSGLKYAHSYKVVVKIQMYSADWGAYGDTCLLNMPPIPLTKLSTGTCGSTLQSLGSVIYSNSVSGATDYKYKFIDIADNSSIEQTRGNSNNYLSLSQVSGLKYAHVYKTIVKIQMYSSDWGSYGDTCLLTMPLQNTKLSTVSCGSTPASMSSGISCVALTGATDYMYKFIDVSDYSFIEQAKGSGSNYLQLSVVNGLKYTHVYKVVVKAQVNALWGSYSDTCLLTMPAVPLTQVYSSQCNSSVPSLSSVLYLNPVGGATDYTFKFTDQSNSSVVEYSKGSNSNFISLLLPAGLQINRVYNVQVKAKLTGVWGNYGTICTLQIGSILRLMNSDGSVVDGISSAEKEVTMYPNPFSSSFNLSVTSEKTEVRIYDVYGKLCQKYTFTGEGIHSLGSEWKSGLYMMEVISNGERKFIKTVKMN